MTVRNLLIVNAIVSIASAAGLGLVPEMFVAPFDFSLDPSGTALARMYGSVLLGIALMCWLGRDLDAAGHRVLVIGSAAGWAGFTVAMGLAVAGGVAGGIALVWVVIGALFTLAGVGSLAGIGIREESRA